MQIERTDKEIIIRISSELASDKLVEILSLIRYGELTANSNSTQDEVDELSFSINKDWWFANKDKFL